MTRLNWASSLTWCAEGLRSIKYTFHREEKSRASFRFHPTITACAVRRDAEQPSADYIAVCALGIDFTVTGSAPGYISALIFNLLINSLWGTNLMFHTEWNIRHACIFELIIKRESVISLLSVFYAFISYNFLNISIFFFLALRVKL